MCMVEYCSAIKKNDIMPCETTWMDVQTVILSEGGQAEKDNYHVIITCQTYMPNLKRNYTNELTDKTETDSQTQRMNLQGHGGEGGEKGQLGSLEWTGTHCSI